jgi:tetratricopeptide (TPR) repeat protein
MKLSASFGLAFLGLACLTPVASCAGTAEQYSALDKFCVDLARWNESGRRTGFPRTILQDIGDFHHYCNAFDDMNRMYVLSDRKKLRDALVSVENNIGYMTSHIPPNHYLISEVYSVLGRAEYLAKRYPSAEAALLKAQQLDPKNVRIYPHLARLYLDTRRRDKAADAVREGLAVEPGFKPLRRLAQELGIRVEPPAEPKGSKAVTAMQPKSAAAAKPTKSDAATSSRATESRPSAGGDAGIGSPNNPYCRFCTDVPPANPVTSSSPGVVPKGGL